MKRRAAIEPKIGHLKPDNRMERNRLKGVQGDQLNALLSACGSNLRKLLRAFFCPDWVEALFRLFSLPAASASRLAKL
jgi:IS5 family transposase